MMGRSLRALDALLRGGAVLLLASHALAAPAAGPSKPFFLTPVIEGLLICDDLQDNEYRHLIQLSSYCTANGRSGIKAASALLDELEPGGPKGAVQIGYTVTVQLLSLYQLREGRWVIDESRVDRFMNVLEQIKRPAVLYLAGNHFDTPGAITTALESDPANLMHLADGSVPRSTYFGYKVIPYTLQTDEAIPVNRYRFDALRHVAARIAKLPQATRDRLVAITLAGEVHQMFPDFQNGMGAYDKVRVTDYSPQSVNGFRAWLRRKYGTLQRLNEATGGGFRSFDEVPAPSRNLLAEPGPRTEHFDGFADGRVPVSGWLWDPQRQVSTLELRVDGQKVADTQRDFNRLDVYRALDAVDDPSVGFRRDIDFSSWAPGTYALQVVARTPQAAYELGQVSLVVAAGPAGTTAPSVSHVARPAKLLKLGALEGVKASLDLPKATQQVLFNPLARDWNSYRSWQVNAFIAKFHQVARAAGLPADKLYSHQIVVRVNSSWNPQFFASDASVDAGLPWKQGFNLYGGATGSSWTARFIRELHLSDYGVPEFHPQQWKRPDAARNALALQRQLGARFVSPYYLSVIADRNVNTGVTLDTMEIRPNNKLDGSDQLFRAIREMAAQ
jgi:hypothetical protein